MNAVNLYDIESVKRYLRYIERTDKKIKNMLVEVYQLRCLATSITAPTDSESIKSSGTKDRLGKIVPKIVKKEDEIIELIDRFVEEKEKRIKLIETLENPLEYDVIHKVYVQYKSLIEISNEINKSYSYVVEIHGRALKNLCKPMETYISNAV